MKDFIVNQRTGQTYAEIDLMRDDCLPYLYEATVLKDAFPSELVALINERDELVSLASISLLDEVEERLQEFQLGLRDLREKIFSPVFERSGSLKFFTRYPTAHGFCDDYPGN